MRYVPDNRHGFGERPHYDARELDSMFERLAVKFLKEKYGEASFPFRTEDLKTFVESQVNDLDQYADLSNLGDTVEGVTNCAPARASPMSGSRTRLRE